MSTEQDVRLICMWMVMQPMVLMEMNEEAACEACDGDTDVALGAWTCRSRWRACSGRCWSSASPSPRGARELRRMQGAGDAWLTVESRDPLGWVCSQCPGASTRAMSRARSGEVSVTDVELVMVRRGAAGRRWFRRVPLDVNGTPDGRYAGRQARRLRAAVALARGREFCSRRLVETAVNLTVNSRLSDR